jgi:hypothetical protein
MLFDIRTIRSVCAVAIGVILAAFSLGHAYAPPRGEFELAAVTGRVTCGGHPLGGMLVMFDQINPPGYIAASPVMADGSFRMETRHHSGLVPGTYRVSFHPEPPDAPEPTIDPKYRDSRTSGLLVHIEPGWNEVMFSLPGAGRGPILPSHQSGRPAPAR